MRTIFVLIISAAGCDNTTGIIDCTPKGIDSKCSASERCDATTKKCMTAVSCSKNSECNGYACSITSVCERNCGTTTGSSDNLCGEGYKCNATTYVCTKIASCDPADFNNTIQCNGWHCDGATKMCKSSPSCSDDTPCGSYACDILNGHCWLSCAATAQCSSGKTCNTTTNTCS
jgi:hypothetical protein